MLLPGILIAGIVGLAVVLLFFGLWLLLPKDEVAHRMHDIVRSNVADTGGAGRLGTSFSTRDALDHVNRGLLSWGFGAGITANLVQADLKVTATEYSLIIVGISTLGALLALFTSGHPVSVLVAALICFFIPPAYVAWRKTKRRKLFALQLPEALAQLAGSLRAGYSVVQSLDTVAGQLSWPSADEFQRVVREVQLGQSLQAALIHMSERIDSDDLVMVISSINIHQQVGGNLAEILDTVAETIRERVRIKREIQVLTAQQRISGYVLALLPIALAAVLLLINPEYEMRLFTPGLTLCIPSGALIAIMVGFVLMQRIVDIDV